VQLDFEKPLKDISERIDELRKLASKSDVNFGSEIAELERKREIMTKDIYSKLTAWQTVQIARHPDRPQVSDYIKNMFDEFIELHGDRVFGDDPSIIGGFAVLGSDRVMVIAHSKGKTIEEREKNRNGMANPEGYRKALRLMKLAEKFGLPVVSLIDTPGAYPGLDAEARGQAEAIARNLTEMAALKTPIVVIITGEGGSGGALALAVTDKVLMLENAIYSVISPEGCASILFRDAAQAHVAAESLKVTAPDLKGFGIVDDVIPEPAGGAHRYPRGTAKILKQRLLEMILDLQNLSAEERIEQRIEKYRQMGEFNEH